MPAWPAVHSDYLLLYFCWTRRTSAVPYGLSVRGSANPAAVQSWPGVADLWTTWAEASCLGLVKRFKTRFYTLPSRKAADLLWDRAATA